MSFRREDVKRARKLLPHLVRSHESSYWVQPPGRPGRGTFLASVRCLLAEQPEEWALVGLGTAARRSLIKEVFVRRGRGRGGRPARERAGADPRSHQGHPERRGHPRPQSPERVRAHDQEPRSRGRPGRVRRQPRSPAGARSRREGNRLTDVQREACTVLRRRSLRNPLDRWRGAGGFCAALRDVAVPFGQVAGSVGDEAGPQRVVTPLIAMLDNLDSIQSVKCPCTQRSST